MSTMPEKRGTPLSRKLSAWTIALAAATAIAPALHADEATTLNGRVVDPNGEPIRMVNIQIMSDTLATTARTDADGRFRFEARDADPVRLNIVSPIYEQTSRVVEASEFGNVQIVLFPQFRPDAVLRAGTRAPELKGVDWISGEWKGFESARGKRVVVAFVSIKNAGCRRAIARLQEVSALAKPGSLQVVLVHDSGATAEEIKTYLTAHTINFPIARVTHAAFDGWYSPAFMAWRVTALPTITLVGPEGQVINGRVDQADVSALSVMRPTEE